MKKIIVPIDFSDCSKNALKNAVAIAERLHMQLILFHSLEAPMGFAEGAPPITSVDMGFETLEKNAKADLERLSEEFPALKKVPYQVEVQFGAINAHIENLTTENDLVLMGSHGASGLKKFFLGSNAYHVMKGVKCPVIAVPENTDITRMKNLAFAIDCHEIPGHDVLVTVSALTKAFFGELHIVHIDDNQVDQKRQLEVARALEKYFKNVKHDFHFIHNEEVETGLIKFSNSHRIELLMLVAKRHSLIDRVRHGSHTKQLMFDIPLPLMVFHE